MDKQRSVSLKASCISRSAVMGNMIGLERQIGSQPLSVTRMLSLNFGLVRLRKSLSARRQTLRKQQ